MAPRKRWQSQTYPESDEGTVELEQEGSELGFDDNTSSADKEQDVWEALKEEHFEAVEQLPLTLQRQLFLMRHLDEQAQGFSSELLPAIQSYIEKRRSINMASLPQVLETSKSQEDPSMSRSNEEPTQETTPDKLVSDVSPPRDLLTRVAWLSEEFLRTSQEKVNLAQAVHDSVERHIRLIDQVIREQEASLGIQPGICPLPILLPELVIPRWSRTARVTLSPVLDVDGNGDIVDSYLTAFPSEGGIRDGDAEQQSQKGKVKKTKAFAKTRQKQKMSLDEPGVGSLKITLPALNASVLDIANEPLYCYCNRISFGEMIACDNESCEIEWFHLECLGLAASPQGEWYCNNCNTSVTTKIRGRTGKRS